jgi:hypothetical protein
MKWITREKVKVDRVACPWLIRKCSASSARHYVMRTHQRGEWKEHQSATTPLHSSRCPNQMSHVHRQIV